jgi:signal transduction histidine kinase
MKDKYQVEVIDDGIGMRKEQIDKLFKLESNTSTNGTDGEKGTGLGLILCYDFINKHDEKIWVESKQGQGSTFYFTMAAWTET